MEVPPSWLIEVLDPAKHRRKPFDCGVEVLNEYIRTRAALDVKRHSAGCWVLVHADDPETILGFYTLSPESVEAVDLPGLPKGLGKKLPRYRQLGAILLGRLAVAQRNQRQGHGAHLLIDALYRCVNAEIPAVLVLVDLKDERAKAFYASFGFEPLTSSRMFLPMVSVAALLDLHH